MYVLKNHFTVLDEVCADSESFSLGRDCFPARCVSLGQITVGLCGDCGPNVGDVGRVRTYRLSTRVGAAVALII